jgi:zinc transport system ATP-binding protein
MEKAIHIDNLSVYYGRTAALTNVCLDVYEGEFLGIMGPNGGGKSTLLKSVLGLIPITSGTIQIYNQAPGRNGTLIGYVPQFATMDKKFPISAVEVVLTGLLKHGLKPFAKYSKQDRDFAMELLDKVGIVDLANRQIAGLSGGEFQKMLIARALAVRPRLLLLDEPTASVDAIARAQIYDLLDKLNKDMTIVIVTHDLMAISSKVKKLACLNGTLVYHGEPELSDHVVNKLYGCPVDLIAHGVPHRVLKEHGGKGCC